MEKEIITNLIRKSFKRKDGKRQLRILVKIGYRTPKGYFREVERHEIKLMKNDKIYTISDVDYENLKNKVSDERVYLFNLEKYIKEVVKYLLEKKIPISSKLIHEKLSDIEKILQEKRNLKQLNDILNLWDIEVTYDVTPKIEQVLADISEKGEVVTEEEMSSIVNSILVSDSIEKEKARIAKMGYDTRYKNGYFNKNNIFEVFGYVWSTNPKNGDAYITDSYRSLILQLNDFRFNKNPSELIKDFNEKWIDDFFIYLVENGYPKVRIVNYDPFNIIKFKDKIVNAKREKYKVQAFEKVVKHFKRYLALLKAFRLIECNKDISMISYRDYLSRNVIKDNFTKREFSLTPEEFNKLAQTDFKDERLNMARDMFIIMVQGGGFRTNEIFKYVSVENNEITVYRPKTKEIVTNPIWGHLMDVIDRHNGIPEKEKLLKVVDFRKALKEIAQKLDFNRKISRPNTRIHNKSKKNIKTSDEVEELIIKDIFNPEFARKTIVRYLTTVKKMKDEDIIAFTSHSSVKTLKHYKSVKTLVEKVKLIE